MNLFEQLRRIADYAKERHYWIDEILIHRYLVARGFVYLVEHRERYFVLMNSCDLDIAISQMPSISTSVPYNFVMGIPIAEDAEKIKQVFCGVFHVPYYHDFLSIQHQTISRPA